MLLMTKNNKIDVDNSKKVFKSWFSTNFNN